MTNDYRESRAEVERLTDQIDELRHALYEKKHGLAAIEEELQNINDDFMLADPSPIDGKNAETRAAQMRRLMLDDEGARNLRRARREMEDDAERNQRLLERAETMQRLYIRDLDHATLTLHEARANGVTG